MKFTEKTAEATNTATDVDVSELTLEQTTTHDQVTLVKEKARDFAGIGREFCLLLAASADKSSQSKKIRNFH